MSAKKWAIALSILFIISVIFSSDPAYLLMLTVAQMVLVPVMILHFIGRSKVIGLSIAVGATCVAILHMTKVTEWDMFFAGGYLIHTIIIACYGLLRFLKRGFMHVEEFMIDAAMMLLAIGGLWFFASVTGMDTGFTTMITWLTAIHFHYASFLLPVFAGLLGRCSKPKYYPAIAALTLISPFLTAIGIAFSVWLEVLSVLTYIVAIYGFIRLAFTVKFADITQTILVRLSISSIGLTIVFSLLYAFSNAFGLGTVDIPFMIIFHGITNCLLFGVIGVIGWSRSIPELRKFPVIPASRIRGGMVIGEKGVQPYLLSQNVNGLVDDMTLYNLEPLPATVKDFYECTVDYRLFSEVHWKFWFKPFAFIYTRVTKHLKQLNLPFSKERVEMTGSIQAVSAKFDGREKPRAWIRKIGSGEVFVAIYSKHATNGRTYMNIALPLPKSSMIGVLQLDMDGDRLVLSSESKEGSDAGIYLAVGNYLPRLPISERFTVWEIEDGTLQAIHDMKILGLPFLTIRYEIFRKGI